MTKQVQLQKNKDENSMRDIFIEKVVLSCGATGQELEKAEKLIEFLSGMKAQIIASQKRIPDFNVRPGLEVGTRVTIRGEKAIQLLRRFLAAEDNKLKEKQISENHFSFGIKEYIEIPGVEYQRDIGIRGLNITVDFARAGLRTKRKKIKAGHIPRKQFISKEEIIQYMEDNFKTKFE
jgi:large subunit ribosomal protein L5